LKDGNSRLEKRTTSIHLVLFVIGIILLGAAAPRLSADDPRPMVQPLFEFTMSSILPADSPSVAKRVYRLRFSPNRQKLAIRDGDNNVWQYDLATQTAQLAERTAKEQRRIQDLAYAADGKRLYGIADRGTPTWFCWQTDELKLVGQSNVVEGRVIERMLSGELIVNGRDVLTLSHPDAEPKIRQKSGLLRSNEGAVTLLVYNMSGISGESGLEWREKADDTSVVLSTPVLSEQWQRTLQQQVSRAVGRQTSVGGALMLSPCGNRVVMLDRRAIIIWDAASGEEWRDLSDELPGPGRLPVPSDILTAKFSPNGQWLVVGTVGKSAPEAIAGEVHLIDMVAGRWAGRLTTTTQSASALDFSDDQRWLAVASSSLVDDRVRVFDLDAWLAAPATANDQITNRPLSLDELATDDPRLAILRIGQLQKQGEVYRTILATTLTYDASRARRLMGEVVEKMDSPVFEVRSHAEREMQILATQFPTTIRELLDDDTLTSESKFRIKRTVTTMNGVARLSEEQWRLLCRSLHALEGISEAWAEQLLAKTTEHPIRFVSRQARLSHQVWLNRHRGP
jgi:hypothetical protein